MDIKPREPNFYKSSGKVPQINGGLSTLRMFGAKKKSEKTIRKKKITFVKDKSKERAELKIFLSKIHKIESPKKIAETPSIPKIKSPL